MTASGLEKQLTKGLGNPMCNSRHFADHMELVSCLNAVSANNLCACACSTFPSLIVPGSRGQMFSVTLVLNIFAFVECECSRLAM